MCCGQKREQLNGSYSGGAPRPAAAAPSPVRYTTIYFEYTGSTALTVLGPVSGRRYRFSGHGARLAIDPRDRPSLAALPRLTQVRSFE